MCSTIDKAAGIYANDECNHAVESTSIFTFPTSELIEIFSYLNISELEATSLVCKEWKKIIDQKELKKYLFTADMPLAAQNGSNISNLLW